jgi:hypothetical protein
MTISCGVVASAPPSCSGTNCAVGTIID